MLIIGLVLSAFLGLLTPTGAAGQNENIVVYAGSARSEIERILASDNLDTDNLSSRVVADTMSKIARGRAPDDFWRAYQAHVTAWQQLADAEERVRIARDDSPSLKDRIAIVASAERRIETTFDEVKRIARRYRARMPKPLIDLKSTV